MPSARLAADQRADCRETPRLEKVVESPAHRVCPCRGAWPAVRTALANVRWAAISRSSSVSCQSGGFVIVNVSLVAATY